MKINSLISDHKSCFLIREIFQIVLDLLSDDEYYLYIDNRKMLNDYVEVRIKYGNVDHFKHVIIKNILEIKVDDKF